MVFVAAFRGECDRTDVYVAGHLFRGRYFTRCNSSSRIRQVLGRTTRANLMATPLIMAQHLE